MWNRNIERIVFDEEKLKILMDYTILHIEKI